MRLRNARASPDTWAPRRGHRNPRRGLPCHINPLRALRRQTLIGERKRKGKRSRSKKMKKREGEEHEEKDEEEEQKRRSKRRRSKKATGKI
eukprot:6990696-Pyramimonas_sp.AAC.1